MITLVLRNLKRVNCFVNTQEIPRITTPSIELIKITTIVPSKTSIIMGKSFVGLLNADIVDSRRAVIKNPIQ